MKNTILALVVFASIAFGAEKLYTTITGTGQQSVVVKGGAKYRLQCRPTSTNAAIVRFRTSQQDGGASLTSDPEIAFRLADGTQLDPYPIDIPVSDTRLNLVASDGGSVDCSLFRMVP